MGATDTPNVTPTSRSRTRGRDEVQLKAKAYKKRQVDGTKNATQTFLWRHQNRSLSARSVDGNDAKCCEQFVLWNGSPPSRYIAPLFSFIYSTTVDPFRQIPLSWWLKLIIARVLLLLVAGCKLQVRLLGGYTHAASFHNSTSTAPLLPCPLLLLLHPWYAYF